MEITNNTQEILENLEQKFQAIKKQKPILKDYFGRNQSLIGIISKQTPY